MESFLEMVFVHLINEQASCTNPLCFIYDRRCKRLTLFKIASMRNIVVYYFIILVPFFLLLFAAKWGLVSSGVFLILLFFYFLYRQFTDVLRLLATGVIEKVTWKMIVNPFLQIQYFKELYWFSK